MAQGTRAPGAEGEADAERRSASCAVAAHSLSAPDRLREDVLEPLVLFLITRHQRTPVHASSFVAQGLAIVLAGPSGTGKSCLARAADEAGFQVLSDDTVYLQREPRLKVWGHPEAAHCWLEPRALRAAPRGCAMAA